MKGRLIYRLGLKKLFLMILCAGFLAVILHAGPASAYLVTGSGEASMDWSSLSITLNGVAFDPTSDPAFGSLSNFSGAQVQLNDDQSDVGGADYGDGTVGTSSEANVSDPNGSYVNGQAYTTVDTKLDANLQMYLTSPDTSLFANQANSELAYFFFMAPADGVLSVSVPYTLNGSLNSDDPYGFVGIDIFAELFLYGWDSDFNPIESPLTSATAYISKLITGAGFGDPISGTLNINYNLTANDFYDLALDVSVKGSGAAPVPEPGTLMLLGSGFLGLAAFGKRFKKFSRKA